MKRRLFVARGLGTLGALGLSGCGAVENASNAVSSNTSVQHVLGLAQVFDHGVIGTRGMAQLYPDSAISPEFRLDSLPTPTDSRYQDLVKDGFRSYRLRVEGLVERPQTLDLAHLRAMKQLVQTTRHDCVEGWSVIGKFGGVPLATILGMARPKTTARYVVFDCFDVDEQGTPYYESLSLHEAAHPQTMLALELNGKPIDPDHGAPVRLKVPTQLGYKSAKWVSKITLADSFAHLGGGTGGYWEDQGYEWYAGI